MNTLYRTVYFLCLLIVANFASASVCNDIVLILNNDDVLPSSYSFTNDGAVTFTVEGGSADNLYRLRKMNEDSSYTIISNPSYVNIGNDAGASSEITINNLLPGDYDIYTYCGNDVSEFDGQTFKVEINENSPALTPDCQGIALTLNTEDIISPACGYPSTGSIKFTIVNGDENNVYRLRKQLVGGGYEVLTNPVYKSIENEVGEAKVIEIEGLEVGNYDLYAFCSSDPSYFSASVFSIDPRNCAVADCEGMELIINDEDIKRPSCGNTDDGSITFTVTRGEENNLYRFRRNNGDGTYTILHDPDYVSLGNALGDNVTLTISDLEAGAYDLYVYCPSDPLNYYLGREITIGESVCDLSEGLIAHYPFNGLANDVSGNENHGVSTDIAYTNDRNGEADKAFYFGGSSNVILPSFDSKANASISFWYKTPRKGLSFGNGPMVFIENDLPGDNDGDFMLSFNTLSCGIGTPGAFNAEVQGDILNANSPCLGTGMNHVKSLATNWSGNTWVNVVFTIGDGMMHYYIDGILQESRFTSSTLFGNGAPVVIGNLLNQGPGAMPVAGSIDDVRIYEKTLNVNEIAVLVGLEDNPAVENCEGISVFLDQSSTEDELRFGISEGSEDNYYRLRRNNVDGTYTILSNPTYVNVGNNLGENVSVSIPNIGTGTFDLFAYCGSNPGFFDGIAFTITNDGVEGMKETGEYVAYLDTYDYSEEKNVIDNGSEELSSIIEENANGVQVAIYPNPSQGLVSIDLVNVKGGGDNARVRIFSSAGHLMYNESITNSKQTLSVNAQEWANGVYYFELITSNNTPVRERIMIVK